MRVAGPANRLDERRARPRPRPCATCRRDSVPRRFLEWERTWIALRYAKRSVTTPRLLDATKSLTGRSRLRPESNGRSPETRELGPGRCEEACQPRFPLAGSVAGNVSRVREVLYARVRAGRSCRNCRNHSGTSRVEPDQDGREQSIGAAPRDTPSYPAALLASKAQRTLVPGGIDRGDGRTS